MIEKDFAQAERIRTDKKDESKAEAISLSDDNGEEQGKENGDPEHRKRDY